MLCFRSNARSSEVLTGIPAGLVDSQSRVCYHKPVQPHVHQSEFGLHTETSESACLASGEVRKPIQRRRSGRDLGEGRHEWRIPDSTRSWLQASCMVAVPSSSIFPRRLRNLGVQGARFGSGSSFAEGLPFLAYGNRRESTTCYVPMHQTH